MGYKLMLINNKKRGINLLPLYNRGCTIHPEGKCVLAISSKKHFKIFISEISPDP